MPISTETEFPPLLSAGFHNMTLAELQELCVNRFPDSKTRPQILAGLGKILQSMSQFSIESEVWIDGSFLTAKNDPNDSDVVVRISSDFVDSCNTAQSAVIDWVNGNLRESHLCDSYVFCEYRDGHSGFWQGEWAKAYWIKQFGFSRETAMKGIALIKTP